MNEQILINYTKDNEGKISVSLSHAKPDGKKKKKIVSDKKKTDKDIDFINALTLLINTYLQSSWLITKQSPQEMPTP